MKSICKLFTICLFLFGVDTLSAEVVVVPTGPQHYTVVKGDTLWDIAGKFLEKPWQWPEVWQANPGIENPHLIYPGDQLTLIQTSNGPKISLTRNDGVLKLSPEIRSSEIIKPIPTIPLHKISQHLDESLVLDNLNDDQAYVLQSTEEHVITGVGDSLFIKNLVGSIGEKYGIYRKGEAYLDPDEGSILGYAALYLGEAKLIAAGEPSVVKVQKSKREILPGDILIPRKGGIITPTFKPSAPSTEIDGKIIKVIDGISLVGQHSVVVINRGQDKGLEVGNVVIVKQNLDPAKDPNTGRMVNLPNQSAGEVMLFRVFDQVSLGLVMTATLPMKVLDRVTSP